jgi:hypothetical protein
MLAKPGGFLSHELAGTDAMGTIPVPGGHKIVPARKCKACGELLSESNYELSDAEKQAERARSEAAEKKKAARWSWLTQEERVPIRVQIYRALDGVLLYLIGVGLLLLLTWLFVGFD